MSNTKLAVRMWDAQVSTLRERFHLITDASLEVIPGAVHLTNEEQPEAVKQAILDHLSPIPREKK